MAGIIEVINEYDAEYPNEGGGGYSRRIVSEDRGFYEPAYDQTAFYVVLGPFDNRGNAEYARQALDNQETP
jgi:hypothetical protein